MTSLRCAKTGNPCGTDTWRTGYECPCQYCQRHLGREEGRLEGIEQAAIECGDEGARLVFAGLPDDGCARCMKRIRALAKDGGKP
jgi:hypothetical protein